MTAPNLLRAPKPPISITSSPLAGELKTPEGGTKSTHTHTPVAVEDGAIAVGEVEWLVHDVPDFIMLQFFIGGRFYNVTVFHWRKRHIAYL